MDRDPLFPLEISLESPILKVFVDYLSYQNKFVVKINEFDYFKFVKKEIGQALSIVEEFNCILTMNR